MEALRDFYIGNARRMGMAGKILFPIPDRHVSRRLYRLGAPTLIAWGLSDRLMPPAYAERWAALIPHAETVTIDRAGHMLPYERPEEFVAALCRFLG